MFESVCESFAKMTNLTKYCHSTGNNHLAHKKVQRVVKNRPIEKTKKAGNSKSSTEHKPSDYDFGNDLFIENYDKDGNISLRFPERKKRVGKIA